MKKILIALTMALSCLGISRVSADNLQLEDITYENFTQYKEIIGNDNFNTIVNEVLEEYKNNYMSSYPYYYISVYFDQLGLTFDSTTGFVINLMYFDEISQGRIMNSSSFITYRLPYSEETGFYRYYPIYKDSTYVFELDNYSVDTGSRGFTNIITLYKSSSNYSNYSDYQYEPYLYYISNFELTFPSLDSIKSSASSHTVFDYDNLLIPKLGEENLNRVISYSQEDVLFEPYYLYDTYVNVTVPNMTEINLNDYAYIALSLKDYTKDSFETTVQVKGQYCITPVYNYGMTERKDILDGTKVERCSPYYDNYTPIRTYILENDLKNNSIYYLKSYDTTRDNYVKVDTSIFDITYIIEENKDNPYVTINGKTYPTIPYDNLTDTATKSEDEGYVSGESEKVSFSDIFTTPLEFLKEIWGTITTFFVLISEFILLLPPVLQGFLYSSFSLAIVLGLIKILI